MIKSVFSILQVCVLCCLMFLYGSVNASAAVERLSVKGTFLVNEKGEKVVLKGVSMGWHNWWSRFYNASAVKTLKEQWNCTLIRAAMGVEPEGAYLSNPEKALKCVTAVAAAIANDVYVIIDWHSHGLHTEEAKEFFSQITARYKGVPNVIYEIFNEPVKDTWVDVKKYSEDVIACIRAVDREALILVGTPHWDQDVHLAADDPIKNVHNIMYTLHFYAATHKTSLRERADYALEKGLPLFVSECAGMEASGDGNIDLQEWNKWQGEIRKFYENSPEKQVPLSQCAAFKSLKNLIISEAMQISHNVRSTEWIQGEVAVREPSVFFATVRLMTGLQKIFQEEFRKENRTGRYHIDRKRRKKLTERRRAQGHRTDDHEPEQQIEG